MLSKKHRISEKGDFEKIYGFGKKIKGEFGMIIGLEDDTIPNCEFGIVVGKKKGKANKRNKFKRRVRNVIQELLNEGFFEGKKFKVMYVAFKDPENFEKLRLELLEQFRKLLEK